MCNNVVWEIAMISAHPSVYEQGIASDNEHNKASSLSRASFCGHIWNRRFLGRKCEQGKKRRGVSQNLSEITLACSWERTEKIWVTFLERFAYKFSVVWCNPDRCTGQHQKSLSLVILFFLTTFFLLHNVMAFVSLCGCELTRQLLFYL